jgi:KDO2-lipid IV(A) lauroyltransferase
LYPLAWLPRRVLYGLSDVVYVLFYYVLSYRKSVVYVNLARSFPNKSYDEIRIIAKQFYRFFSDLLFENVKTLGTSKRKIQTIVTVENAELVENYLSHTSVVLILGHFGNWEYLASLLLYFKTKIAYKPQKGASDRLMRHIRTRYSRNGDVIIPMQHISRWMLTHRDEHTAYVFIADQSPSPLSKAWVDFLHQDSLFFEGAEKMAKRLNLPVIYVEISRPARGKYKWIYSLISEEPEKLPEFEITRRFASSLEASINRYPPYWLWSHKRWKHRRTNGEELNIKN